MAMNLLFCIVIVTILYNSKSKYRPGNKQEARMSKAELHKTTVLILVFP